MKIGITGHLGFIGKQLIQKFELRGDYVNIFSGDIRDPKTFLDINYTYDYFYHFAAPSSQVQFARNPQYCIETTLVGFMNIATACKRNNVKLVYPSTGILSHGKANEYARCKAICEDYAQNMESIGLRIFASYGPYEGHKRDFASVPYLFAKEVVNGRKPVVFGSGEQVRDFIYIDDAINAIVELAENSNKKVVDIGSGVSVSFNEILKIIYEITKKPNNVVYVPKPNEYVDETHANVEEMLTYYRPRISLHTGLNRIIESLKQ
jgi:nucleoside-diphosphate-sugar epimerase